MTIEQWVGNGTDESERFGITMTSQSNAKSGVLLTLLALVVIAVRSPLFWKASFGLLILSFFASIVTFDITCSCPDQQKIKAPLYAVIAATSLCVNVIPVGRRRLSSPIQFDFFKWQIIFDTEDSGVLQSIQDKRNEAVLAVNVLVGAVAGFSTFFAGVHWLANESSDSEYTWLVVCLGVVAVSSIQLAAVARYMEEKRLREEDPRDRPKN